MKKYMALYMAPVESFEKAMQGSKEDMQKGMEVWNKWMADNKNAIVDEGAPLGKAKRVDANGASDVRNTVGGYSVVQAESLDEAAKLFLNHPHYMIEGGWVEVIEFVAMPGM